MHTWSSASEVESATLPDEADDAMRSAALDAVMATMGREDKAGLRNAIAEAKQQGVPDCHIATGRVVLQYLEVNVKEEQTDDSDVGDYG